MGQTKYFKTKNFSVFNCEFQMLFHMVVSGRIRRHSLNIQSYKTCHATRERKNGSRIVTVLYDSDCGLQIKLRKRSNPLCSAIGPISRNKPSVWLLCAPFLLQNEFTTSYYRVMERTPICCTFASLVALLVLLLLPMRSWCKEDTYRSLSEVLYDQQGYNNTDNTPISRPDLTAGTLSFRLTQSAVKRWT